MGGVFRAKHILLREFSIRGRAVNLLVCSPAARQPLSVTGLTVRKRLMADNARAAQTSSGRTLRRNYEMEQSRAIDYQPLPADLNAVRGLRQGNIGPAEVFKTSVARGTATV